jgi:hypothetical protein
MFGRRSRVDAGIDWSLRSSNFARRIENAMKVSIGDLRSVNSSSVTNAERKLEQKNSIKIIYKIKILTVENDVIQNRALLVVHRVIYKHINTFLT